MLTIYGFVILSCLDMNHDEAVGPPATSCEVGKDVGMPRAHRYPYWLRDRCLDLPLVNP